MYVCILKVGRPRGYNHRIIYTSSIEEDLYEQFKEVCWRERRPMNELLQEFMKKYLKEHGSGNPVYKLDKWQEDPEFRMTPAFGESQEKWIKYVQSETSYEEARENSEKAFWIHRQYQQILDKLPKTKLTWK